VLINPERRIIASVHPAEVGREAPRDYDAFLRRAFMGQPTVSRPFLCQTLQSEGNAIPAMWAAAPALENETNVVAVLALRMRPRASSAGFSGRARGRERRGIRVWTGRGDAYGLPFR